MLTFTGIILSQQLIAQFGEKEYAIELADCHYGVYQMLGKLRAVVYTLVK